MCIQNYQPGLAIRLPGRNRCKGTTRKCAAQVLGPENIVSENKHTHCFLGLAFAPLLLELSWMAFSLALWWFSSAFYFWASHLLALFVLVFLSLDRPGFHFISSLFTITLCFFVFLILRCMMTLHCLIVEKAHILLCIRSGWFMLAFSLEKWILMHRHCKLECVQPVALWMQKLHNSYQHSIQTKVGASFVQTLHAHVKSDKQCSFARMATDSPKVAHQHQTTATGMRVLTSWLPWLCHWTAPHKSFNHVAPAHLCLHRMKRDCFEHGIWVPLCKQVLFLQTSGLNDTHTQDALCSQLEPVQWASDFLWQNRNLQQENTPVDRNMRFTSQANKVDLQNAASDPHFPRRLTDPPILWSCNRTWCI